MVYLMLDILIIGSGPAGLSAAIYTKRANLNVMVVEKTAYGIGQIAESSEIDNYLGFPNIRGFALGKKFREHATCLGVEFKEGYAEHFEFSEGIWKTVFKNGDSINAKAIIYAAGAFHRHLNILGEKEFAGKGVSYCATCDGAFYQGKVTAVVGGGNTALDYALYLSSISSKVYIIHRRKEFRGSIKTVQELQKKENVEFMLEAKILSISGEDMVQELCLEDGRKIKVSGVFIAAGMIPMTEPVKNLVMLDPYGYIIAEETGETSAKGFFAAGDVRTKALRQVITAASDGANAAVSAERYLYWRSKNMTV